MRVTRKIRSRQSMARWLNYQVTTWMTDSSSTDSVPSGSSPYPPTLPAENTDRKNKRQSEPLEASLLLSSASDAIPPHGGTSNEADLSEPLPALDTQVKLLSDLPSRQTTTPFASFPSLPPKKNTPPKTQRSNSRKTQPQMNPSTLEQANQPPSPQQAREQDHPSASRQEDSGARTGVPFPKQLDP
jgi:hypothetical protein